MSSCLLIYLLGAMVAHGPAGPETSRSTGRGTLLSRTANAPAGRCPTHGHTSPRGCQLGPAVTTYFEPVWAAQWMKQFPFDIGRH